MKKKFNNENELIMYEKVKEVTVELFNVTMEKEGSTLRYVKDGCCGGIQNYKISTCDKYIDSESGIINLTNEAKNIIKEFFNSRGVEFMFSNTVYNI